jgi:hypothetical protein
MLLAFIFLSSMVRTGDWTAADLIKYLASVQSTLTTTEMGRLTVTSAFTQEDGSMNLTEGQKPSRYCASELYEPLDIHRQLRLPVIDWGKQVKWRGGSEEGWFYDWPLGLCLIYLQANFLYKLGLRRFPPLDVIIKIAAGSDATLRSMAMKYFLDNIHTRYSDYDPANFSDIAYIPAFAGQVARLGTPKEVRDRLIFFGLYLTSWKGFR